MFDFFKNNYETILTFLPLTVIFPILYAFIKMIFNSFAIDEFDLIFLKKEKRTLIISIKLLFTNLGLILFIFASYLFIAYIIQIEEHILVMYIILFSLLFGLFIIWLVFYFIVFLTTVYIELKRINGFKNKLLNIFEKSSDFTPNQKYVKFDYILKFFVIYFFGVTSSLVLINPVANDSTFNTVENWILFVLLIFAQSILLVLWGRKNIKSYKTHFKYVDTYYNYSPIELYLDRILDNSTHFLSDKDNKYKAIKYLNNDNMGFVIQIYKVEKREIILHGNKTGEEDVP